MLQLIILGKISILSFSQLRNLPTQLLCPGLFIFKLRGKLAILICQVCMLSLKLLDCLLELGILACHLSILGSYLIRKQRVWIFKCCNLELIVWHLCGEGI